MSIFFRILGLWLMSRNQEKKYDKVMRENLVKPSQGLIRYLLSLENARLLPMPPITRQTIIERETDTIVKIKAKGVKSFILHLEFQSSNDNRMVARMAVYDYMLYMQHRMEIISIVLYTGYEVMKMNNRVFFNGNNYAYRLIDIREIDPEVFLQSDNPGEIIFALLAKYEYEHQQLVVNKIITKLCALTNSESDLRKYFKELQILSCLRSKEIQERVIKKIKHMPIVVDMRRSILFQQVMAEGKAKGKAIGKAEGFSKGVQAATKERNRAIVLNLLQYTNLSVKQIAQAVSVSPGFVTRMKNSLGK